MSDTKFGSFKIPQEIFDELYELSGSSSAFKGFIIALSDEEGNPMVCTSCDSPMTENGLLKSLHDYLKSSGKEIQEDA